MSAYVSLSEAGVELASAQQEGMLEVRPWQNAYLAGGPLRPERYDHSKYRRGRREEIRRQAPLGEYTICRSSAPPSSWTFFVPILKSSSAGRCARTRSTLHLTRFFRSFVPAAPRHSEPLALDSSQCPG